MVLNHLNHQFEIRIVDLKTIGNNVWEPIFYQYSLLIFLYLLTDNC